MKPLFLIVFFVALATAAIDLEVAQPKTLVWEDTNATPVLSYKVYMSRGDTNGWFPLVITTNLSITIILKPDVYYFRVTALGFWGETDPSNIASTPPPETNAAPSRLYIEPDNRSVSFTNVWNK